MLRDINQRDRKADGHGQFSGEVGVEAGEFNELFGYEIALCLAGRGCGAGIAGVIGYESREARRGARAGVSGLSRWEAGAVSGSGEVEGCAWVRDRSVPLRRHAA